MFSKIMHFFLIATALAPILVTSAIAAWGKGDLPWILLAVAGGLVVICVVLLRQARTRLERVPIRLTAIETADHEVLAFILAYLLPLLTGAAAPWQTSTGIAAAIVIALVVFQSGLTHVNPLLGILGWRFFKVTTDDGCRYLLITRADLARARRATAIVRVSSATLLQVDR